MKCNMKHLKTYNESISSYLKPRKDDDIRDKIKNLSPNKKLLNGSEYGLLWLVEEALQEGADPSFDDQSAFNIACDYGNIEIVKLLLNDKRIDPSDLTGFMWALESNHYNIMELLLKDDRVDPSINDNDAIIYSSNTRNYKSVKILLNDKRVLNKLNKSQIKYYKNKINTIQ